MDTYRADIPCERVGPPTRNHFTPDDRPSNRLSGQLSAATGACLGGVPCGLGMFQNLPKSTRNVEEPSLLAPHWLLSRITIQDQDKALPGIAVSNLFTGF